jgi:hypothetical protein
MSERVAETDIVATVSWTNDSRRVTRRHHRNGSVSYSVSSTSWVRTYTSTVTSVAEMLAESDSRIVTRNVNRTPATYTLTAPALGDRLAQDGLDNVDRRRVRIVVTERGFVQRMTVRQTGRLDGATVATNSTISYHDVGTTTVERPPWVATALENRTRRPRDDRNVTT